MIDWVRHWLQGSPRAEDAPPAVNGAAPPEPTPAERRFDAAKQVAEANVARADAQTRRARSVVQKAMERPDLAEAFQQARRNVGRPHSQERKQ